MIVKKCKVWSWICCSRFWDKSQKELFQPSATLDARVYFLEESYPPKEKCIWNDTNNHSKN